MPLDREIIIRMIEVRRQEIVELEALLDDVGPRSNGLDRVEIVRQFCREQGIVVLPNDCLNEADAGRVLSRSARTIANWQRDGELPRRHYMGRRVVSLADIARLLEPYSVGWPIRFSVEPWIDFGSVESRNEKSEIRRTATYVR